MGGDSDESQALPEATAPAAMAQAESARVAVGRLDQTLDSPPLQPAWNARAAVPGIGYDQSAQEWYPDGRPSVIPILIGACVVLLSVVIALGVWLAAHPSTPPPQPQPTDGGPSLTSSASPSGSPSASLSPSATTSPTPPGFVVIPDVAGQSAGDATKVLTTLGVVVIKKELGSTSVPAGKVIGTDPSAGSAVRPGTSVDLIVSTGKPKPTTAPPTLSPTP